MTEQKYVVALDQGTTSSRAVVLDHDANIVSVSQREFTQIYPQAGWVEHDPMEIYATQSSTLVEALGKAGIRSDEVAAIGITNQRETTVVWNKETGKPVYNAIVWQCRRTAAICEELKERGLESYIRDNTGLVLDPYFSGTKIKWILDNVEGAREQAEAGQLLLMEERATIARELHDSLAQSLSYLKIQLTLLKRSVTPLKSDGDLSKTENIIREIDKGLSDAYTQLRELLTTFRLTLTEGSFGQSLLGMLTQLSGQTDAKIELNNALSSIALDAHQQVHLVQLIREATINAIKHAKATKIKVNCQEQQGRVQVTIEDDGVGFDLQDHKINHYGMSIMQERAARLRGELKVESAPGKGCKVVLTYQQSEEKNKNEL